MAETNRNSDSLNKGIRKEYQKFMESFCGDQTHFFGILHKKIKGKPHRARFAHFMYQYSNYEKRNKIEKKKGKFYQYNKSILQTIKETLHISDKNALSDFFTYQFPFILEVIISIQYYHNQILDAKGGVSTSESINDNLIKANLLKDHLYRHIGKLNLSEKRKTHLTNTVRSIFELVDIGQFIEKKHNTYRSYQKILKTGKYNHGFTEFVNSFLDDELINETMKVAQSVFQTDKNHKAYLQLYLQRIFLTNAALYYLSTELITDWLEIPKKEAEVIHKFAIQFGLTSQMVNDNCDFIPSRFAETTTAKVAEDGFSDLKNGNITLPLFIHLSHQPLSRIRHYLERRDEYHLDNKIEFNKDEESSYFYDIVRNQSIFLSMKIPKELKKYCVQKLSLTNPFSSEMSNLLSYVGNNRYYRYFYKSNKGVHYKKYKNTLRGKIEKTQLEAA